jgi:hypothetical protein
VDRGAHLEAMAPEPGPRELPRGSLASHGGGARRRGARRNGSGGGTGHDGDEQSNGRGAAALKYPAEKGTFAGCAVGPGRAYPADTAWRRSLPVLRRTRGADPRGR